MEPYDNLWTSRLSMVNLTFQHSSLKSRLNIRSIYKKESMENLAYQIIFDKKLGSVSELVVGSSEQNKKE